MKGGTDLLPKTFAAKLAEKIRYGAPVVKIEHSSREVRATFLTEEDAALYQEIASLAAPARDSHSSFTRSTTIMRSEYVLAVQR